MCELYLRVSNMVNSFIVSKYTCSSAATRGILLVATGYPEDTLRGQFAPVGASERVLMAMPRARSSDCPAQFYFLENHFHER